MVGRLCLPPGIRGKRVVKVLNKRLSGTRCSAARYARKALGVSLRFLQSLVTLLRFETERGHRPGLETLNANGIPALTAVTVAAVLNPPKGLINFDHKLPGSVTGSKLEATPGFRRRAIGEIRRLRGVFLQVLQCQIGVVQQFVLPGSQFLPEVLKHHVAHKRLIV